MNGAPRRFSLALPAQGLHVSAHTDTDAADLARLVQPGQPAVSAPRGSGGRSPPWGAASRSMRRAGGSQASASAAADRGGHRHHRGSAPMKSWPRVASARCPMHKTDHTGRSVASNAQRNLLHASTPLRARLERIRNSRSPSSMACRMRITAPNRCRRIAEQMAPRAHNMVLRSVHICVASSETTFRSTATLPFSSICYSKPRATALLGHSRFLHSAISG